MSKKESAADKSLIAIMIAALALIGTALTAYFNYRGAIEPVQFSIRATQTAEAKLTLAASSATPSAAPPAIAAATDTPTPTPLPPTDTPTPVLPTETPTPSGPPGMVYVPAGEFIMGSSDADVDSALALCNEYRRDCLRSWYWREQPQHTVYLDAFYIDRTEVTNAQYQRCVVAGVCQAPTTCELEEPSYGDASKAEHPVVCVSWHDAKAYCEWAGARLPTEAEWEYAARGSQGQVFPWGDEFDGTRLNYCDANCKQEGADKTVDDGHAHTAPVGSYPAGASWCGALDMAGNVWEYVADWYDSGYYSRSPERNPPGPDSGKERVIRGGSWLHQGPIVGRSAYRAMGSPDELYHDVGFRCARGSL